jgi:hypothetical protein
MSTTAAKKYVCAFCGKQRVSEEMIYSAHTGARYCGVEMTKCEQKHRRNRRRGK